jgi:hypothetical protein
MSGHFRDVGKELGVTDPKSLEDVYKTHLENTRMCCTFLSSLRLTTAQDRTLWQTSTPRAGILQEPL